MLSKDITLSVTAPNGNVITIDQIPSTIDGEFATIVTIDGPLWSQDGFYTVDASQSDDPLYNVFIVIDIKDGVITN